MRAEIKTLRNKAEKLWIKIIHLKGSCERCGKTGVLHAHHIIGRKNIRLKYDLRNGCLLCAGCHKLSSKSAHEDPIEFMFWLMNNRNEDYNYLIEHKEELVFNVDYEGIIEKLSKIYKRKLGSKSGRGLPGGL